MLRTALALAKRKLHVFPCLPRGKEPAVPGGFKAATTDPQIIHQWWCARPDCNIGIATGALSGVFAVDVDDDGAEAALKRLEEKHGTLPDSVQAITPRGRHIYFKMPGVPVRNSAGKVAPGIDVRGDGGYVLAPPSIHPTGRAYCWGVDSADAVAAAPDWLLALVTERSNGSAPTPAAEWRALVLGGVSEGQRNSSVTSLAGHMLRRHLDPIVVLEMLQIWNAARCAPPLPPEDIERIVGSICKRELGRRRADG